ncbi:hypothetical protein B0182_00725 [Moraxella bovis]|nr:hypothetical protein B0182_00725 [Moraxella bovis]
MATWGHDVSCDELFLGATDNLNNSSHWQKDVGEKSFASTCSAIEMPLIKAPQRLVFEWRALGYGSHGRFGIF